MEESGRASPDGRLWQSTLAQDITAQQSGSVGRAAEGSGRDGRDGRIWQAILAQDAPAQQSGSCGGAELAEMAAFGEPPLLKTPLFNSPRLYVERWRRAAEQAETAASSKLGKRPS